MYLVLQARGRGLLVLAAAMTLTLSACGGNSSTPTPSPTIAPTPTDDATVTNTPTAATNAGGLSGAGPALANLTSYKFTMTLVGATYPDTLSSLVTDQAAPVAISGTMVLKPAAAAEIVFAPPAPAPALHLTSVDGFDYTSLDVTQGYSKNAQATNDPSASPAATAPPTTSDSVSPAHEFALLTASLKGYDKVGTDNKNGVDADHYQGSDTALAEFGSIAGVKNATSWAADIWVANTDGYPVSVAVVAKAKDGTTVYQISFDLTKVNDPANKVTAPENVTGA